MAEGFDQGEQGRQTDTGKVYNFARHRFWAATGRRNGDDPAKR